MQAAAVDGVDAHGLEAEAERGRRALVRDSRCRKARADALVQQATQQSEARDCHRDTGQPRDDRRHLSPPPPATAPGAGVRTVAPTGRAVTGNATRIDGWARRADRPGKSPTVPPTAYASALATLA